MRFLPAVLLASLIVAAPAAYGPWKEGRYRNFRAVEDGVLYRSGQLPPDVFARVTSEYGVRTVVSLRDSYTKGEPPDSGEQAFCEANGLRHIRISPEKWSRPDGTVPAAAGVNEFLRIMADPAVEKPVLVHCFAGIHRTGAHVAAYRMQAQGWPAEAALAEMFDIQPRRAHFEDDLLGYLRRLPAGGKR